MWAHGAGKAIYAVQARALLIWKTAECVEYCSSAGVLATEEVKMGERLSGMLDAQAGVFYLSDTCSEPG